MKKKKAALYTLGCKLNQFETMFMQEQLETSGYMIVPFKDKADVYVINTCTVTNKADYHSRMKIRQAIEINPEAFIVAAGCSVQIDPLKLAKISGVDLLLGNTEKGDLIKYLVPMGKRRPPEIRVSNISREKKFRSQFINHFCGYTRAFLKIQEGCNQHCSYCIVPKARGRSRSADAEVIFKQAHTLIKSGYKELVLTGIHLGRYGCDLEGEVSTLADLLEGLIAGHKSIRLRLSSIEPTEFTPALKKLVTQSSHICAHLHIPLQSGDNCLLHRMHRPYTCAFYKDLIEELVSKRPQIAIGADIMVGFPGETEESFQKAFAFIEALPLAYLHVFSFSPRPGTEAAKLPEQIDGLTKRKRCALLRGLSKRKTYAFRQRFLGAILPALILGQKDKETANPIALTGNYIKVAVPGAANLVNRQVEVRVTKVSEGKTLGQVEREIL